jgi:hypothetical protein
MNIHQINIDYDPSEDRVLMRMNTQEKELVEVWLTRKIALQLLPALEQLNVELLSHQVGMNTPAHDAQTKQLLADLAQQKTLENANFSTPFENNLESTLTGARPLLVTQLQASLVEKKGLRVELTEKIPSSQRQLDLMLDIELLQGIQHLLSRAISSADWKPAPLIINTDDNNFAADMLLNTHPQFGYLN